MGSKQKKKTNASASSVKKTNDGSEEIAVVQGGETATTSSTSMSSSSQQVSSSTSSQQQTSSSTSTSEQKVTSSSSTTTGGRDSTHIVEVTDNGKLTMPAVSIEYTVTGPPDTPNPGAGKVHYVFGGTQISEVASTEKQKETADKGNKSGWDGKFTQEKPPVNRNKGSRVIVEHPDGGVVETMSTTETHASSSSSSVQKSSSSSYVVEIGPDGKERVIDSKSREWGSSEAQSQAESFKAKSGTGIETEITYAAKDDLARTKYDSGDGKNQKPIYEHSAIGSEAYLEQVGKNEPIQHLSEHAQNVSYDAKTNKFLTSSGTVDNKATIAGMPGMSGFLKNTQSNDRKTVSIDSTALQHLDKSTSATSIVDQTERFINEARGSSSRNAALTTENMEIFNTSSSTKSSSSTSAAKTTKMSSNTSKNVKDITHTAITEERRGSFDETASNNTFIVEEPFSSRNPVVIGTHHTDRNQSNWNGSFVYENQNGSSKVIDQRKNLIDSTTTYTSKVFDGITNTWRIVDETTVNEKDVMIKDNDRVMKDHSRTVEGTSSRSPVKNKDVSELPAAGRPSVRQSPKSFSPAGTKARTPSPTKKTPSGPGGPSGNKDTNIVSSNTSNKTSNITSLSNITDSIDQLDVVKSSSSTTKTSEFVSDYSSTINQQTSSTYNKDSLIHTSTPMPKGPGGKGPITSGPNTMDSIDNLDVVRSTTSTSNNNKNKTVVRDSSTINNKNSTVVKDSKTNQRTTTTNKVSTTQVYDEKTKTWREVDEKTLKTKRPSLVRYVSREDDGTFTTIFKRKVYDSRTGRWNVVDEKVYKDRQPFESIPEMSDESTNTTTTTYTTKVYDTRTGTWTVVDEQKFVDKDTRVPTEIVQEIEKDHADVANITTTTEITKVSGILDFVYYLGGVNAYFDDRCLWNVLQNLCISIELITI